MNDIRYTHGYFIGKPMYNEVVDLIADDGDVRIQDLASPGEARAAT